MEEAKEGRKDLFLHTKSSNFPPFSAFDIKQSKKRKTQCFLIVVLAFAIVEYSRTPLHLNRGLGFFFNILIASRNFKKIEYHLYIFKRYLIFPSMEGVAQKVSLLFPFQLLGCCAGSMATRL